MLVTCLKVAGNKNCEILSENGKSPTKLREPKIKSGKTRGGKI
jgi:hypothetical protein